MPGATISPVGVDLLRRGRAVEVRERGDAPVAHADVDAPAGEPGPVDDETAAHDEVEVGAHDTSPAAAAAANAASPLRTTRNARPSGPAMKP